MARVVGVVAELNRYPVKSMAAEPVASAEVRWMGLRGDREYGFVFADRLNRFPWLSARNIPDLVRYQPLCGDYAPSGLPVEVWLPDGRMLAVGDPELRAGLAAAAGAEVGLVQISRGAYDSLPVSLISTATHAAVDTAHGMPVDPRRFRSNVIVESGERDSEWQGHIVQFGRNGPRLAVSHGAPRCAMITIDPETARRDPSILRTVAQKFDNRIASYCSVLRPGFINVGDEVRILDVAVRETQSEALEAV